MLFRSKQTTFGGGGAEVTLDGLLQLEINTSGEAVDEEFVVDTQGSTEHLVMAAGKYLRLVGDVDLGVSFTNSSVSSPFALRGSFVFEQISLGTEKVVRIAASKVDVEVLNVSLTNGQGGFLFTSKGLAGKLRATVAASGLGEAELSGNIVLEINTTGQSVNQTITIDETEVAIKFTAQEGNIVRLEIGRAHV